MQFIDIAVNLGDGMFRGSYHGKQKHEDDLAAVVQRARDAGVKRQILTGTSLDESKVVLALAREFDLHSTAGCHPTSTTEIDAFPGGVDAYFSALESVIEDGKADGRVISIGEVGLDYDRLKFAPRETQLKHLARLLLLSKKHALPLFLHDRHAEAHADLVKTLKDVGYDDSWPGAVAHSFTGTEAEMRELVTMGIHIGVNGCSLKTEENLAVVRQIPADKLMLETDAPWCSITSTAASAKYLPKEAVVDKVKPEKWVAGKGVKGRNEPAEVVTIAHVVAGVRGEPVEDVARAAWENTLRVFYPQETL